MVQLVLLVLLVLYGAPPAQPCPVLPCPPCLPAKLPDCIACLVGPTTSPAAGLCITTVVSYLSHSQVWAAQAGSGVMVGGQTNRAKVFFEQELTEVLGAVPEVPLEAPELVGGSGSNGGKQGQ